MAAGLSPTFALDGDPGGRLHAARHFLGLDQLAPTPELRSDRHRRGEAHLLGAVVDAHRDALDPHELREEVAGERHREVAVRDRRAERPVLGPLDVAVDPLVVERRLGELVDLVLGDRDPVGGAEIGADGGQQRRRVLEEGAS